MSQILKLCLVNISREKIHLNGGKKKVQRSIHIILSICKKILEKLGSADLAEQRKI